MVNSIRLIQLVHVTVKNVVDTLAGPDEPAMVFAENSNAPVYVAALAEDVGGFADRIAAAPTPRGLYRHEFRPGHLRAAARLRGARRRRP